MSKPVTTTEPINDLNPGERTIIVSGDTVLLNIGSAAPWLSWSGVCLVKVWGLRRSPSGEPEFGIGNEKPPVLAWVKDTEFHGEWPD